MKNRYKIIFAFSLICIFSLENHAQSDTTMALTVPSSNKVVEVAYGQQSNENVSAAISTATGEELVKGAINNFPNTLYGRFPGLFLRQGSGEPTNDFPLLRIRGAQQTPLVIIDGFERDLSYLAPEEIESVSVLKDAAALALYGMDGSNGAIVIKTKRGRNQEGEIKVTLQSGIQTPTQTMGVLGAADYMRYYNQAASSDGLPEKYSSNDISSAGSSPRYPDVDWQDLTLKEFTNISRANVGFLGGSEFVSYYVNFGFLYNDGIYKPVNPDFNANTNLTRMNVRSNIDIDVTKKTVFSIDLAGSLNRNVFPADNTQRIWTSLLTLPPNAFNAVNPDNSYGGTSVLLNNPLGMLEKSGRNTGLNHFLNATFRINQDLDFLAKGLSTNLAYVIDNGVSYGTGNWRYFTVKEIAPGTGGEYNYYSYREDTPYNEWSNSGSTRSQIFVGDVNYSIPQINGNKLDFMVRLQRDRRFLSNGDLFPYLTNNLGGRIQYARNNKYLLDLTASYFGSDQYAEGNQYGFFPAASVGWVFSNEAFLADNSLVNFGKVTASYGLTGNNRYVNGRYPFQQFYENGQAFPLGTNWDWFGGIRADMLANPDIKWEVSRKLNVGIELGLLDAFSLEADYYVDRRSDMLFINFQNPSFSGANIPFENIGELRVNGFDVKAGYATNNDGLNWYADVMFSQFNTEVLEMGEAMNEGSLEHLNRTGNSLTAIFGYNNIGTFSSEQDIENSPTQMFGTPRVGDLKYEDLNNDGMVDSRDITVIGDSRANMSIGLRFGLAVGGFDVETFMQGQLNHDIDLAGNPLAQPFIHGNAVNEIVKEEDFPTLTLNNMNNYQSSSYWIRNGNFLKFRNIEVGYTLPLSSSSKIGAESMRIYLRGINLITISPWKYTDPEFTGIGYPPMKSALLGLNVNF